MLKTSGAGTGNPFQYSCLENFIDRGAWWTTVHGSCKQSDMTEILTHTQYLKHVKLSNICNYMYHIHMKIAEKSME